MYRVLHIITRLIPGGADENTVHTVEGLDKSKYEVELLVGGQSDKQSVRRVESVKVHILPALCRELSPVRDFRALAEIARLVRRNRYHIVHTHTAKAGIVGRLGAFLGGAPHIVHTLHGTTFHDSLTPGFSTLYMQLERFAGRVTDRFIAVGEDLVDRYVAAGVAPRERFVTIRSAFHLDRFQLKDQAVTELRVLERKTLGLDDDAPLIGSVSRIEPRKGLEYFVRAAADIVALHPTARFVIAGDGHQVEVLEKLAADLGLNSHITFLGHREDVERVLASLDVVVLTSLWEGLPRVLVQAAAMGRPCVSFDVEGAREIIEDGVNGYVVPKRDVAALVNRIDSLISNRASAEAMGQRGRSKVTAEWDIQVMVQRISETYDSVVWNGRGGIHEDNRNT